MYKRQVYNMFIRLVSLGIILKLIDLFEFDFTPFYEEEFEKYVKKLISVYFAIFVVKMCIRDRLSSFSVQNHGDSS